MSKINRNGCDKIRFRNILLVFLLSILGVAHADGEHWSWNPYQYSDNATFMAVIDIDGVEQRSDQLEVAAFYDGECRGSIICVYVPPKDRYFAYLTVNGVNGMEMSFRLWDHATEAELNVTCDITYTFIGDDHNGVPSNPYVIPFTSIFNGVVFNGSVSTSWFNVANWSGGVLPEVYDNVLISSSCLIDSDVEVSNLTVGSGAVLTVQSGSTLNVTDMLTNTEAANFVIKDGAQLINASEGVAATVERDIVGFNASNPYGCITISSPVDNMLIEGSDFLTPDYDLYRFNETNLTHEEWENYSMNFEDFTTFENGRGYLYANSTTFSPRFMGTLNHALVNYDLTCTDRPNDQLDGFNLIGNPFPHVIYKGVGGAIDDSMLASGYYTLNNDGAWQVHTYDEAIQPGQGIFVKTMETKTLGITKINTLATAECASKDVVGRLNLGVVGESSFDRAIVYFGEGIGLEKIPNFSADIPSLSVWSNNMDYAIAHVDHSIESLDVRFKNTQNGSFTLSVTAEGMGFDYLHFIDHVLNVDVDLLQQSDYVFTATGDETQGRFTLMFTTTYAITATANPTDGGIVTGEGSYYYGSAATLTATANEGYTFVNWTKGSMVVSTEPTFSFTVTEMGDYVANFIRNTYAITTVANPTEGGTVTGEGTYYHGSAATLTATANEGYTFTNWTKNGVVMSVSPTYSFVVTETGDYEANFVRNVCTITATTNPVWGGEVIGTGTFTYGETVTLQVVPNVNFTFLNWTVNGEVVSEEETYSFIVTEDRLLVANLQYFEGVEDYSNATLSIYPNPANSILTVEAGEEDFRLEVFNMTGERIYSRDNCMKHTEINVSDFADGTYVVRVIKGDAVKSIRFVKQ